MKYFLAATAAFLMAVIYVAALPYWRILGVTPDLVLIFVACWAMLRGQREAMLVVPVAAVLRDLATSYPVGTSLLALAPIVLLTTLRDLKVVESDFVPTLAVVAIASLANGIITMAVLTATGQEVPWFTALRVAVLP
ncbi:MAG: rod shape-determining protein MreD, partial [Dehalococcoidia bacterium]